MWDFHRSKSSAILIGRCRQTPRRTTGNNRILTGGTGLRPPVLQYMGGSGTPTRPKRDTSRTGFCLAPSSPSVTFRRWLLTPPEGEFEQKFLYRYGPAQVGLDRSIHRGRSHRLRLSRRLLRLTQWVRGRSKPPPPRCRQGVNSPYLSNMPLSGKGRHHREFPRGGVHRTHLHRLGDEVTKVHEA